MKFNKIMLSAIFVFGVSSYAAAEDPVVGAAGKVTFAGKIVDAPCSIHPDSVDQTVNMGSIANGALKSGGKSTPQSFILKLTDCDIATKKSVETMFTGGASESGDGHIGVIGSAKGISVGIGDTAGNLIALGTPVPSKLLVGSNDLEFTTFVKGDAKEAIIPGEFQALARFILTYK